MNLNVPDHILETVAALLREDESLGNAIIAEYDSMIATPYEENGQHRENIRKMKSEQSLVVAKLIGWWRLTLTTNNHDWREETTNG